jgi:hypothetical protein
MANANPSTTKLDLKTTQFRLFGENSSGKLAISLAIFCQYFDARHYHATSHVLITRISQNPRVSGSASPGCFR